MSPGYIYRMDWRKEVWKGEDGYGFLNPGDRGPGHFHCYNGSSEISQEGLNPRCIKEED